MPYLVCFLASIMILLWAVVINENMKINQILLLIITVISNGGYYALANSTCLETAILANKLTYLLGIFSPMLIFFNICEICKIRIKYLVVAGLYTVQMLLYMGVLTIGSSDLFYKTVQFHVGNYGGYLTKTYGPLHSLYLAMFILYLGMSLWVSVYSLNKKNGVSYKNADLLIFTGILIIGTYFIERVLHLRFEFVPITFTVGLFVILISVTKTKQYVVEENSDIIAAKMEGTAYIVFSRKLLYMGCNEYAAHLFPELLEWKVEKKIPGNGGRFNTFLRQTFMKFVESRQERPMQGTPFTIKDRTFRYTVKHLYNRKRQIGYVIELIDVTEFTDAML